MGVSVWTHQAPGPADCRRPPNHVCGVVRRPAAIPCHRRQLQLPHPQFPFPSHSPGHGRVPGSRRHASVQPFARMAGALRLPRRGRSQPRPRTPTPAVRRTPPPQAPGSRIGRSIRRRMGSPIPALSRDRRPPSRPRATILRRPGTDGTGARLAGSAGAGGHWVRRFFECLSEQQHTPTPTADTQNVCAFLTHLAVRRSVSASTQNQAMSALLFLCHEVLDIDTGEIAPAVRARRGHHLPVVLSVPEVGALLRAMRGTAGLMATLIYGGGLRVSECCELRVKDVDFDQGLIFVRSGKGDKDRSTLLPHAPREQLRQHLLTCEVLHRSDRTARVPGVWLPEGLDRKYPNAGREWGWFWFFPSRQAQSPLDMLEAARAHTGREAELTAPRCAPSSTSRRTKPPL